jgi:outer membrane protein with beta-barrel domain
MKRTSFMLAAGVTCLLGLAPSAHAQMAWTDKGFVNVSVGAQAPSRSLATNQTPEIYGEASSFASTQDVGGGAFFDISGGYKVWRNLVAGIGITHVGSTTDLTVDARIPDPLLFDAPRSVTTTVNDVHHSQTAINLTGTWMMPVTDKVDVGYQFGPTIFLVSQDLPGVPTVSEPGPTITSLPLEKSDKTTVGLHFGIDVTYLVTPRFGVGGLVRYTWGSVDLDGADDSLTVGGFQIGVGARLRF